MQKKITYLVVAAMIISAALMSCDKKDDNRCICVYRDINAAFLGGESGETLNCIMYPNPTSGEARLEFKTEDLHIVSVTDWRGRVLFNQSFDAQSHATIINVSDYPKGEYRVSVKNSKQKSILCLIKK